MWEDAESDPFSKRLDVHLQISGGFLGGQVFIDRYRRDYRLNPNFAWF